MTACLALDMASDTGWAIKSPRGTASGVKNIAPAKGQHAGMRYKKLLNLLIDMHKTYPEITMIAYEHPIAGHRGINQAAYSYGCMAVVQMFCAMHSLISRSAYPSTVKKYIAGRGNADKNEMISAIRKLGFDPEDDNEADALGVLLWATQVDVNK